MREHNSIKYLWIALEVCRASHHTPSIRDLCRFVYGHLKSVMPITRLFCVVRAEPDIVRFRAFVDNRGEEHSRPDRELREGEPLAQAFGHRNSLSNKDLEATDILPSPELEDADSWVLVPLASAPKLIPGVVGACSDQANAFSDEDIELLEWCAEAILTIMTRTSVIDSVILSERDQIMDETAGDLIHEIANLLGTIPVYVDMMREQLVHDATPSPDDEFLETIKSQAIEIQSKCRNKLDEIKERKGRSRVEPTDIVALLESARSASLAKRRDVYMLSSEISPGVPRVLVRPREVFEVLKELIRNGLWAMQNSEERKLTLRAEPIAGPDDRFWAQIEIEDTGCGIPESDLVKIWELSYSTKSSSGGYGLYRAKSLIESFGGHIEVRSRVNSGTTFTISLPGEPKRG